jgi:hypothetical protein
MFRRKTIPVVACLGLWMLWASVGFAQVFVEGVFPPSVVRSKTTRVTLSGSNLHQAVGLWTSLPDEFVRVKQVGSSSKGSSVFDVAVSPDAPLGLYGLRLATSGGLSNAHLFLIDDLQMTSEQEQSAGKSSSSASPAQKISLPTAIAGTCSAADVDRFSFEVVAGQTIAFEAVANRLGKYFDPLVTVRDSRRRIVIQRDNDVGLFFDCRFEHTFPKAGRYTVEIRDSRFRGNDTWGYVLRMGRFPVARVALPSAIQPGVKTGLTFPQLGSERFSINALASKDSRNFFYALKREGDEASAWIPLFTSKLPGTIEQEPNDAAKQANKAVVPGILHGVLERPGDRDRFMFELKKGESLNIRTETRGLGSPADLELVLFDPQGRELKRADDSGFDDAAFSFTSKKAGMHTLLVRDLVNRGGPEFVYRVEFRPREPQIDLASGVTRLAIPQGTYQPLPLTLTRTAFRGSVELSLLGAPAGVKLKNTSIAEGTGDITNVFLVDAATPTGIYTVQVVARATSGDSQLKAIARTQPMIDRLPTGRGPHGEPFALQENQRQLPPTLTDRIALLIIPKPPFNFELSDEVVELPRFLHREFEIKTTRIPGFDAPITFVARGGTLEADGQMRREVKNAIPVATTRTPNITGVLTSGVLSKPTRHRVTITGSAEYQGHTAWLTRTFELDLKVAFNPSIEPTRIELRPGATVPIRIQANRLAPFDGDVTISPSKVAGIELPEMIVISTGEKSVQLNLKLATDIKPGKYTISFPGSAKVNKFQESARGHKLEIVVKRD